MRHAAALLLLAALPALGQEEPQYDWILTFHNGDSLHCRLFALQDTKLTVQWQIAPETPVTLELKAIAQLARAEDAVADPPAQGDVLRLKDGSVLHGRAVRFTPRAVEWEMQPLGRLTIETTSVVELARGATEARMPRPNEGEHVVATKTGTVLTGKLETDEFGQLVLRGEGMTATIDYDSVALVLFPQAEGGGEAAEAEERIPGVQVRLRNGSLLGGREPRIEQGELHFKLATSHEVKVPLEALVQLSFLDYGELIGRIGLRTVLVWGRWSDAGDEFRKTINILSEHFQGKWTIKESMTQEFDRAFKRELFSARTLVIPEMEQLRAPHTVDDARELQPLLQSFVKAGGNVVILGVQAQHVNWVKEAGLFDLSFAGQVDGQVISFTPEGKRLGEGLVGAWQTVNASFSYMIQPGIRAETLAETGGKSIVVGRKVGRGWILCIGTDYYMTNENASRVLINAITHR